MLVGIYTRVSTLEQANEGYSLGEQEERLKSYCDARGWTVSKVYKDGGFSGADMDRPALKKMIKDIKDRKIETVIVYKLDRLSRSQKDTLNLIEDVFIANDVNFISINENFDTSTPFGKAMIGILSVFAQLEREQIKERMNMGKEGRAKKGLFQGGSAVSLGYDYINGQLVINDYEASIVKELFTLYTNGIAMYKIAELFKVKYTENIRNWRHVSSIKKMLTNKLYYGVIVYHGEEYEGQHEAIISKELFDKAQERLKETAKESKYKTAFMSNNLLSGSIWCGGCGARYYTNTATTKSKGTTYKYKYYKCYSRSPHMKHMIVDPNCKNKTWKRDEVDNLVIQEILKLQFDKSYLEELRNKGKDEDDLEDKIVAVKNRIDELSTQLDKVMDMYQLGAISLDKIAERVKKLNDEKEVLEIELHNLELGNENKKTNSVEIDEALSNAQEVLSSDDIQAKRMLVQALIERVIIHDEHVDIHWNF